jgi:uncharacterized protein YacL (UPF0231 family)
LINQDITQLVSELEESKNKFIIEGADFPIIFEKDLLTFRGNNLTIEGTCSMSKVDKEFKNIYVYLSS